MTTLVLQIIVGILGLARAYYDHYQSRQAEIQRGRTDIADGNADAVTARVDRLLNDSPVGQSGGEVTAGRISSVCGLADTGRGDGKTAGAGGVV